MSIFLSSGLSPLDEEPQIDLTPLIDCLFMLIIFFVLTMSFSRPVLEIVLPESKVSEVKRADRQMSVFVREDGSYWMDNQSVSLADVEKKILSVKQSVLNIHMDSKAPFNRFVSLVDLAKEKNEGRFVISTRAKK